MLKPWRELAVPHEDVLKGTFQQAEFAADISRVHARTATDEYQNPVLFFQRTFITEGMRLLLDSVVKRLVGQGGDPVIQLQTAFGGGKTHTMLAVYHLAKGEAPASDLPGHPADFGQRTGYRSTQGLGGRAGRHTLARIMPQNVAGHRAYPVGRAAWQWAERTLMRGSRTRTPEGRRLAKRSCPAPAAYSPCVILMDELVAYIRQFEDSKTFSGGTYDSNLTFVQALTEALKAVPKATLLASLPESDKEAGS